MIDTTLKNFKKIHLKLKYKNSNLSILKKTTNAVTTVAVAKIFFCDWGVFLL